jgi:hypothetical protein
MTQRSHDCTIVQMIVRGLLVVGLFICTNVQAKEGTLDIFDGETLYEDGWLVSLGYDLDRASHHQDETVLLSANYGLRHDVQLGALVPLQLHDGDPEASDPVAAAKWRFYRWDAPGEALNVAALGTVGVPHLASRAGIGATYEPKRWRFNAVCCYAYDDDDDDALGRSLEGHGTFSELAIGNRFYLEPYPGPFLRLDVFGRHDWRDGGQHIITGGANLAFRPRPSLDFQIEAEYPLLQRLPRSEPEYLYSLSAVVGFRF